MIEKSLCEEFCKICGIKPVYGIYVNFGDLDNDYRLVTNKRKYRLIADYRYRVDDPNILRDLEATWLPNFENNDNKLKLLQILAKYSMTCIYLQDVLPIDNAMRYCIAVLKDTRYAYKARNQLKLAINQESWIYE